jgi:hypothetical protein
MKSLIKIIIVFTVLWFASCKEDGRFEIGTDDSVPPAKPVLTNSLPLYGGARLYFTPPDDKDLLNVEAAYTNPAGKTFYYAASFYTDSLDVYGFPNEGEYTVDFYAVDRAGNKSEIQKIKVLSKEPSISLVAKSLYVKQAIRSFFVNWTNEIEQRVNVYVTFTFHQDGKSRELTSVFSSDHPVDRHYVYNLDIPATETVGVKITVEDMYGNRSEQIDMGRLSLLYDEMIPKDKWFMPLTNDSIAGIPQCFGDAIEGKLHFVIDGLIDEKGGAFNAMNTNGLGRTGVAKDGNIPWNILIDLGDYYELSRIVTHQQWWLWSDVNSVRGILYDRWNVKSYKTYFLDEDTNTWELIMENTIPVPEGMSDVEISRKGREGDEAYMYPDEPGFTRPVRWFRYEALSGFTQQCNAVSEITLYGRKAGK